MSAQTLGEAPDPATAGGADAPHAAVRMIVEVELGQPLRSLARFDEATGRSYGAARVLVRLHTEPLGFVDVDLPDAGLSAAELGDCIWATLGDRIASRVSRADLVVLADLERSGLPSAAESPYLRERSSVLAQAPSISVVVCTRDRAAMLARCLDALSAQSYPQYEIIVVDNAPTTDDTAELLAQPDTDRRVRRVVEPRPGLARARNRGLAAANGDVVVYIDDDAVADRYWLREIGYGFHSVPDAACVTGMILPATLDDPVQALFEEYGGHSKGRGFTPAVFDPAAPDRQSPLYPLPPFGAGGNMAFARWALEEIGGFDTALGAGVPTKGAEDTAAFTDLLLRGRRIVYQPTAFVWHHHRSDIAGLRSQLYGYGVGLMAYYTRIVLKRPWSIMELASLLPVGLRDMRRPDSVRHAAMTEGFPPELLHAHRRGMLAGPYAYVMTRLKQRLADVRFSMLRRRPRTRHGWGV